MQFPGRIIKLGEADAAVVAAIRATLIGHGYHCAATGGYDPELKSVVQLFQAQHVDLSGRPLHIDGEVGPNSWGALFGAAAGPGDLLDRVLAVAVSQVGVMEVPPGSNSGPAVSEYLRAAGGTPGDPWCMSFVYWCFNKATAGANPMPRSPGVLDVYQRTRKDHPSRVIGKAAVIANPGLVTPGWVFIQDHGHGQGHTGFVRALVGGALDTVEGNTNVSASREGLGVFELKRRSITDDQLVGFLDFSR